MKTLITSVFLSGLLAVFQVTAQEVKIVGNNPTAPTQSMDAAIAQNSVAGDSNDAEPSIQTFIPSALEVLVFNPPPPPVAKRLPSVRVNAAVTYLSKNNRLLTLQRGEASTEPDLPAPPPPAPVIEPTEPTPEQIERRLWQLRHTFDFGATVYDHKVSEVSWTDRETLVRYEAVCGFDIGLLAGIGSFVHKDESYSFYLMHSDVDTTILRKIPSYYHLKIPQVPEGEILITQGDPTDKIAIIHMSILRDVIALEKPRLLTYQIERKAYFAASAAWEAAHPPIPRDETFILRPHRGSHYLQVTQPAKR